MKGIRTWAWILFFGSLWGINEVMAGGILFGERAFLAPVWLAAWAFFILAVARGVVNKSGTSTLIGGIAALFKLVNAAPFFCHLLGIFFLGVAFDAASSLLLRTERRATLRQGLTGVAGAYGGFVLFALVITTIVRYEYWVAGGAAKVLTHILVAGSLAAAASAFIVPLGYRMGSKGWPVLERHPLWSSIGAAAGLVLLWILGRMTG